MRKAWQDRLALLFKKNSKNDAIDMMNSDSTNRLSKDCPICEKSFDKSQSLYGHLQSHGLKKGKYAFDCKICNLQFKQLSTYWKHLRLAHEETKNRPYSCSKCPESENLTFERKSQLQYHNERDHQMLRPHSCKICAKVSHRIREEIL